MSPRWNASTASDFVSIGDVVCEGASCVVGGGVAGAGVAAGGAGSEEFLPRVEGINFISDAELSILPKWIHKSLGVDSNALESRMKDLGV